jgi:hypothetical protein
MLHKTFVQVTLCGLLLGGQVAGAQTATSKHSLVGSWEFTAQPNSSSAEGPAIAGLATFLSSGNVIETDTSEAVLDLTPGHGIWQPSPAFGHWFVRFTSLVANRDGSLHAKKNVTMTVALNSTGEEFTGGYSFEIVDPTGHVITTGSGTVDGRLMVHPLLP